jgi:hypothetical protein
MPNPFTTLRREILKDILKDLKEQNITISGGLTQRFEAGGSFDQDDPEVEYPNEPEIPTDVESLRHGRDHFQNPNVAQEFESASARFDYLDLFAEHILAPFAYPLRVVPERYVEPGVATQTEDIFDKALTSAYEGFKFYSSTQTSLASITLALKKDGAIDPASYVDVYIYGNNTIPTPHQPWGQVCNPVRVSAIDIPEGDYSDILIDFSSQHIQITPQVYYWVILRASTLNGNIYLKCDYGRESNTYATSPDFINFTFSKLTPVFELSSYKTRVYIWPTQQRPALLSGALITYQGGVRDLREYLPAPESEPVRVLLLLNPLSIPDPVEKPFDALGEAVDVISDEEIIDNIDAWPKNKIPLAIVRLEAGALDPESLGLELEDIQDVRPVISWGSGGANFLEKLWFEETALGLRRYYFDEDKPPRPPYNTNTKVFRNGQELTYGLLNDYTIALDEELNKYYIELNYDIKTGERLKAWYVS